MSNPSTKPRAIAATLLAFVLVIGLLGGIALDRLLLLPRGAIAAEASDPQPVNRTRPDDRDRRGPGSSDGYLEFMTRELELTPEQRSRIEAILQHQQERVLEITKETRPALRSVAGETRSAIDEVLTQEQRDRFSELRERRDRAHQQGGPPGERRGPRPN